MKITKDWILCIFVGSLHYLGLAVITEGPRNQTSCYESLAFFHCVTDEPSTIIWTVNGKDLGMQGITPPGTDPLPPGSESTLALPSSLLFSGASVVCSYMRGQTYRSFPAFLTIQGPSSPPVLTSIPCNTICTCTSISWQFTLANSSALIYQVQIRNKTGLTVFNETFSGTQLMYTYTIPDPCDRYDADVTAIYMYQSSNVTCIQQGSVQIVGAYPSAPLILTRNFFECLLSAQGFLNVNISVMFQQAACSYNIFWTSSGSQPISYLNQKPIASHQNQSIFNISLPFNLLGNLTVIAANTHGNNSNSTVLSTSEIIDVTVIAISFPGSWSASCTFLPCSQSIGCLVVINNTYCAPSKRNENSLSSIICPITYSGTLPGPGVYSLKAYAVLQNGSYVDSLYTRVIELKNEDTSPKATQPQQTENSTIVAVVIPIVIIVIIGIIIAAISIAVIVIQKERSHTLLLQNDPFGRSANIPMQSRPAGLMNAPSEEHTECANPLLDKDENVGPYDHNYLIECAEKGNYYELAKLLTETTADKNGQTALIKASREGHSDIAHLLLDRGAEINLQDKEEQTALMEAASGGQEQILQQLIDSAANLDCQDNDGNTILHLATRAGKIEVISSILQNHFSDANVLNDAKESPLMTASIVRHFECAKILLQYGAKVDCQDWMGETALMKASSAGYNNCALLLLENGANIELHDHHGKTALMKALSQGHNECEQLLLKWGANVESGQTGQMTDSTEEHYFHRCSSLVDGVHVNQAHITELHQAASIGDSQRLKQLISITSAEINKRNESGKTPLHIAAEYGHKDCLLILVEKPEVEVNIQDKNGDTALHIVAHRGLTTCLSILLKAQKIDVNIQNQNGSTPLHLASESGVGACLKSLLSHSGVDKKMSNKDGDLALHLAAIHCRIANLEAFKLDGFDLASRSRDNSTILHYASKFGWQHGIQYILKNSSIDVNSMNNDKHTALHCAAKYGHEECTKLLIQNSSNVNVQSNTGNTPLHRAVINGHVKVVETLLNQPDIEVNLPNNNGNTPLNDAAVNGFPLIMELLLKHFANVNTANKNGNTPLHHAAQGGFINVVKLLLENQSIDVDSKNNDHKTAIDISIEKKNTEITNALHEFKKSCLQGLRTNKTVQPGEAF